MERLLLIYILDMLHSSSLRPRAGKIKWGDGEREEAGNNEMASGWEKTFPPRGCGWLCRFVPAHTGQSWVTAVVNGGTASVQPRQRSWLWKSWILPWLTGCWWRKRQMQPGLLYMWHLNSSFGCSERFTMKPKGSSGAEKDWQFLLVFQPGCCAHAQRNTLHNSRLRAHRQK